MQNLLVFCQYCFSWVEPHSLMCPDCASEVDLDQPDLEREVLSDILGTSIMSLGNVGVDRQGLPSYGELIATTEGILFFPRLHRRLNGAWEGVVSTRVPAWWPFRGDHHSTRFLEWLRHPLGVPMENEPAFVPSRESAKRSLADRMMDSPGAFFAAHRSIRSITSRRRTVKLNRSPFRSIVLIDETENGTLHATLDSAANQAVRRVAQ